VTAAPGAGPLPLTPSTTMLRILATLAAGTAGGAVFTFIGAPLPWMMGAMVCTTLLSLAGLRLDVWKPLRSAMIMVLGVLLGSAFTPEVIAGMQQWPASLGVLAIYIAISTALLFAWFRWVLGYDAVTAYFSGAPGGLTEMVTAGAELGGDDRVIALVHAGRILFVVLTIPLWFRLVQDAEITVGSFQVGAGLGLYDAAALIGCAALGYPLARWIRLPAALLLGPMVVSAVIHATEITTSSPPAALVAMAQVVIGSAIGARFAGVRFAHVSRILGHTLGATAIMLALAITAAWMLHAAVDVPMSAVVLAFAPGGLTEMSLVALALQLEVAFVATHHIARIALIIFAAPLVFRLLRERGRGRQ
jgi:uncharacterized protein